MQLNNTSTHALIYVLLPKCGMSNKFNMPTFYNPDAHSCGLTQTPLVPGTVLVHKYLSLDNLGNFCVAMISWSINFRLAIFLSMYASMLTPTETGAT